ncbi:lactonase family protein [Paenarthrobacter aurescens]|jgi:6-phosphogluconolactonase (cycloisomerase 2 family)|uniref:ATP/GTP-binding protein n=1 Tax=Paenarthrobacter aurescens (strain TC1) TaxID=290340 RepID=A1R1D6_PAEAT|nr:beta-propeller fold lactonase family protein [Paenarthrobacter aurescens]ABM09229.1 putative ATP/GTP-binding protein [Paenarthrobacter aurescens TC1]
MWVGSYTADRDGKGEGIVALSADDDGKLTSLGLAIAANSPSFLALHPSLPVVYAVAEEGKTVRAYRRTGDSGLEAFGDPWPAGEATCHVAADPQGRFIVATCWGDGQVILYELDHDGAITSRTSAAAAVDPHTATSPDGERPSRAHSSLMLPDGRVMTTDLGHDLVRVWQYSPGVGLQTDHQVILPKGSGPRHMARHHSGTVFVDTEYSVEVAAIRMEPDGTYELTTMVPASATGAKDGDAGAEIALSPDGRFAYVGVRGSNRICILKVSHSGGELEPVAEVPCGGEWPRHHLVREGWLYVANEGSDDVVSFKLDSETGLPDGPVSRVETGSPSVLVPAV